MKSFLQNNSDSLMFYVFFLLCIGLMSGEMFGGSVQSMRTDNGKLIVNSRDGKQVTINDLKTVIATSTSDGAVNSTASFVNDANLQITLTPGLWLVDWNAPMFIQNASGGLKDLVGAFAIRDGSDAVIENSEKFLGPCNDCVSAHFSVHMNSASTIITVPSTQTYKLAIKGLTNQNIQFKRTGFGPNITMFIRGTQIRKDD